MRRSLTITLLFALTLSVANPIQAQTAYDGPLFDQGRTMTTPSPGAPAELSRMLPLLGHWDVSITTHPTDTTTFTAVASAEVTLMNRGHGFMERMTAPAFDAAGRANHTMSFLFFSPAQQQWALGEGSSYTSHIALYNGTFSGDDLVLTTAVRVSGGGLLTWYRLTYTFDGPDALTTHLETSRDSGTTWKPNLTKRYTRAATPSVMAESGYGIPHPDRPTETAQFDFLIGTWNAAHRILLGNQWIQYNSTATAVHVLGGYGILEHSWFDTDPSLPDASTSILRLYNPASRRWESLYVTNRANGLLHFGGQQVGDDIVLNLFDVHAANSTFSRFVFHNITPDRYDWYAESSTDRGKTFNKTWTITITKQDG